jgi:hypothetical protein
LRLSFKPSGSFEQQTAENFRALLTWCAVLSVALVVAILIAAVGFATASSATGEAAVVAKHQAQVAKSVAKLAQTQAEQATSVSVRALQRLQAEASGECYRTNYLRWQIDRTAYAGWRRDLDSARFLFGVRTRRTTVLARAFKAAADAWRFLPLTDCTLAITDPTAYRSPGSLPFERVPRRVLERVLGTAPQPPAS